MFKKNVIANYIYFVFEDLDKEKRKNLSPDLTYDTILRIERKKNECFEKNYLLTMQNSMDCIKELS